jgi:ubiquinone biosynthesis protein Coq4
MEKLFRSHYTMGFNYLHEVATPENINQFLEFIDLAAGAGVDTNNVFNIEDKLRDSLQMQKCIEIIQRNPASAAMLTEKYISPEYDLEAMHNMPKHSLGWTYAKLITVQGYNPKFYRLRPSLDSDTDYITHRIRKTHDIHHVVTGFSMKGLAELGVIAITVAQTAYPGFLMIDLLSMLLSFLLPVPSTSDSGVHPLEVETVFDIISLGIKMGREIKPLFPIKWEEGFEKPLDQWREELGIQAIKAGPLSWYSDPALHDAIA